MLKIDVKVKSPCLIMRRLSVSILRTLIKLLVFGWWKRWRHLLRGDRRFFYSLRLSSRLRLHHKVSDEDALDIRLIDDGAAVLSRWANSSLISAAVIWKSNRGALRRDSTELLWAHNICLLTVLFVDSWGPLLQLGTLQVYSLLRQSWWVYNTTFLQFCLHMWATLGALTRSCVVITDRSAINIVRQRNYHAIISPTANTTGLVLGCSLMLRMGVGTMVVELLDVVLCELEAGVNLILLIWVTAHHIYSHMISWLTM